MSASKTVEVQTQHGDVAYEVVTCVNCGEDVVPSGALIVGVEFEEYRCSRLPFCRGAHERPIESRVLCAYCADAVLDYPARGTGDVRRLLETTLADRSPVSLGLWFGALLAVGSLVGAVAFFVGLLLLGLF